MVWTFSHYADEWFCTRCTYQYATFITKFTFSCYNSSLNNIVFFPTSLCSNAYVYKNLWVFCHDASQFRKWLAFFFYKSRHLNSSQHTITSCVMIEENDVTRLFTANGKVVFTHIFQYIAITNSSRNSFHTKFFSCFVEANITHNGTNYGIAFELTFFFQFKSA